MKKVIFIGKSGCGKTSLCQCIQGEEIKYKKTQAIELYVDTIDTPGEYLENRHYYSALVITAADASKIALVQESGDMECKIPPGFAATFGREVFGIITKTDKSVDKEVIDKIKYQLRCAGVKDIFEISVVTGKGIKELVKFLEL